MALSIGQIYAASYDAVLNKARPENQWTESAFMREMQRLGMIVRKNLSHTLEISLDWRRNPGAGFLATDLQPTGLTKTEVLTAAQYSPVPLSVPVVWSKMDEAENPSENQKFDFVAQLQENAINSHDDIIEEALFATSTNGFLGLQTLIADNGQGNVGGIDASLETFWRNPNEDYQGDGSDIEAVLTELWNSIAKGSGSAMSPKFLVSGSDPHALYEGQLQANQRYVDTNEGDAGFKILAFKTARYSFSQYGGSRIYMANPKSVQLIVSKDYFRDKSEIKESEQAEGFKTSVFSALQLVTGNKSRVGVADEA